VRLVTRITVAAAALAVACREPVVTELRPAVHLGLEGEAVMAIADTPWGLFVGTSASGVYHLAPTVGATWQPRGLDHAVVAALLFVPGPTPMLLAGMRNRSSETTAAALFASTDSGKTWTAWDGGLAAANGSRQWAFSLGRDAADPRRLFMGQAGAVLRSDDDGVTWKYVIGSADVIGNGVSAIVVDPRQPGRVYAGGTTAFSNPVVHRSSDWFETSTLVFLLGESENVLASLAVERRTGAVFAGVGGGVLRSLDYGASWQRVFAAQGFLASSVLADDDAVYAVGTLIPESPTTSAPLAVFRSRDGGTSWQDITPVPNPGGSNVAVLDTRGRLLIGTTPRSRGGLWLFEPPP